MTDAAGPPTSSDQAPARPPRAARLRRGLRLAVRIAIVPILIVAVVKAKPWTMDLSHAQAWPLAVALAINFGIYLPVKALRWRLALVSPPRFSQIVFALLEGGFVGAAIGFGAGDAVRSARLRREGGNFMRDFGATMAERAAEFIALALLLMIAAGIGAAPRWTIWISVAVVIGYAIVMAGGRRLVPRLARWPRIQTGLSATLEASTAGRAAGMTFYSLAGWGSEVIILMLALYAFGLPAGAGVALFVLVGINIAIAVPGGPMNLGTFEAGIVAPLMAQGIEVKVALTFALSYHALMSIPMMLVGAIVFGLREHARRA